MCVLLLFLGLRRGGVFGVMYQLPHSAILEQHPQVKMSARKELHFFDSKLPTQHMAEVYVANFAR